MNFADEVHSVPERARQLVIDVVMAQLSGRALPLAVDDAALLREHGLIDHVAHYTDKGRAVATDAIAQRAEEPCP